MKQIAARRDLRRFGFVMALGLVLLGALAGYRGHPFALGVLWTGAISFLLAGIVWPPLLRPVMRAWLGLGMVLGWVNTRIILSVLFYVVVAPVGLLRRLIQDPLDRRIHDGRSSFWIPKEETPSDPKTYENQF